MMRYKIDEELASELLTQLLVLSNYAEDLTPVISNIIHVVNVNNQLNHVIQKIIEKTQFVIGKQLDTRLLDKQDIEVIKDFFEYLYFTSSAFLETDEAKETNEFEETKASKEAEKSKDINSQLYDVCIVGTGAAGGILAHRLALAGLNVISVEQGEELAADYFTKINPPGTAKWHGIRHKTTFPPTPADALFIHDLFAQENSRSSSKQSEQVFRQFQIYALNGLQNLWNGVSVRFSDSDFQQWPISYQDLVPYYSAVEKRISVCGTSESIEKLPDGEFIKPKPLRRVDKIIIKVVNRLKDSLAIPNRKAIETRQNKKNHCISTGICTYGCPVGAMYKFSVRLLPEIRMLDNYTLLLNAKVESLQYEKDSHQIKCLHYIDTKTKEKKQILAKTFVLSAGAIETPRILFNSKNDAFPHGLANSSRTLGCFLQDNPKVVLSTSLLKLWFSKKPKDIGYGDLLIILSKATLKSGKEFRFIGHSISAPPDIPYYLASFRFIPRIFRKYIAKALFNSYVTFGLFCEGDLSRDNCVKPSQSVDKYNVPQVDIQYQSSSETVEKMQLMAKFGRHVLRRATATVITEDHTNDGTGIHYAGTCRMGFDPNKAIVDKHLKTFDHDNLYLCDGGVIPHLPDKHLTLTIMALSDRLADHLINLYGVHNE